ncbi:MAG: segregation and condensation protein A [Burkholderiales bacterium]|nr:segregation and condensation protein A [Burkholderiales bacterium]
MSTKALSKEQRILRAMRKTLASVIKDVTPKSGYLSPLSDETVEGIKECFTLISIRERELADELGMDTAKPHYVDEVQTATVVNFIKPKSDKPEGQS